MDILDEVFKEVREERPPARTTRAWRESARDVAARLTGAHLPHRRNRPPVVAVLGFDFGSVTTKLAIRLPYMQEDTVWFVPGPIACTEPGNPYLWRSEVWLSPDGEYSLTAVSGWRHVRHPKVELMLAPDESSREAAMCNVIGFLSLHIRQARGWFTQAADVVVPDEWKVHLGFPAATLDGQLGAAYEQCGRVATRLAQEGGPCDVGSIRRMRSLLAGESDAVDEIRVVPEIGAAVSGLAYDTTQPDGRYVVVDVGGTTVDACAVWINRDGRDLRRPRVWIEHPKVERLGAVVQSVSVTKAEWDTAFVALCDWTLREVIDGVKQGAAANERWRSHGLLLVLLGGGSEKPWYRNRLQALAPWMATYTNKTSIHFMPVPLKEEWHASGLPTHSIGRMVVAVGLCREEFPDIVVERAGQVVGGHRGAIGASLHDRLRDIQDERYGK